MKKRMNCKQGDLAIVVRSINGNEGKIVRCIEVVFMGGTLGFGPRWLTDPPLEGTHMKVQPILDACMRPIRGIDGKDEMLSIAKPPMRETQAP